MPGFQRDIVEFFLHPFIIQSISYGTKGPNILLPSIFLSVENSVFQHRTFAPVQHYTFTPFAVKHILNQLH